MDIGDVVPDFELPDQDGTPRRLSQLLADGPVVLFFYPVASSSGCTTETCHFRDLAAEFQAAGAQRVGISTDSVAAQKTFHDANHFDYPLLSDADSTVAASLGVKGGALRRAMKVPVKRVTFVIGTDRRILGVVRSETSMTKHADEALATVKAGAAT